MKKPKITNNTMTDIFNHHHFIKERRNIMEKERRNTMEKLLTVKQQLIQLPESEFGPISELEHEVVAKLRGNRVGKNIASELENGIEITLDNIDYWNNYKPFEDWNDYRNFEHWCGGPHYGLRAGVWKYDGEYNIGDMVSAFDYIKHPYDILHIVDSEGNYKGGVVDLFSSSPTTPKIQIDTVNKKVNYYGWDYTSSFPYNNNGTNTDELLEGFWKSHEYFISSGMEPDQDMMDHIDENTSSGVGFTDDSFAISYDYTFSIPYSNDLIGINEVLRAYWESQQYEKTINN